MIENAEKSVHIQKQITINQLTNGNVQTQELSKQIQELQTRVKAQDAVIEKQNKASTKK